MWINKEKYKFLLNKIETLERYNKHLTSQYNDILYELDRTNKISQYKDTKMVYCSNCKYYSKGIRYYCESPRNRFKMRDNESEYIGQKYPEELNWDNNCKLFRNR